MREYYIVEIGPWENFGTKRVWRLMEGGYNEVLLYLHLNKNNTVKPVLSGH